MTRDTGEWILSRWSFLGLVDITPSKEENLQVMIVKKTLQGLESYVVHLHDLIDGYINLDTEMKTQNLYGTILKHKNVRKITELLELATSMIKDTETKFGVSIAKEETKVKTQNLMNSIESIIGEFDSDVEAQNKSAQEEQELDTLIKSAIPKVVIQRSKELSA